MHTFNADTAWAAVTAADPALLDRDGLARLLASIERVRAVCATVEVVAVRRSRALADCGTGEPAENLLVSATGSSSRQAHLAAGREQACEAMPAIESALSNGLLSAAHVDAAAGVHGRLGPDVAAAFADHAPDLAQRASTLPVDMFERECRDLARHLQQRADTDAEVAELERQQRASTVTRWVDRSTGMHKTLISLDPLRDSRMWKVISAEVARERQARRDDNEPSLPFAALQAAAVVTAVTAERADSSAQRVPEVGVFVDLDTLKGLATEGGIVCEADDGTPLPITTVRRLCCDAHIIPIVLGSDGAVLDQGRRVRTATAVQRTAIAAMHRSCAFPGCTVSVTDCRIHHVRWWWSHRGTSDLDNLIPLCERHHHLVHEGQWNLTMTADRIADFSRPDGSVFATGSTLDRRPRDVPMLR